MRRPICTALALAAVASGCGDDSGSDEQPKKPAPPPLAKPIHPSCGTEALTTPQVTHTAEGWILAYRYPSPAPRPPRPGQTTGLSITERSPQGALGSFKGRARVIAGRQVRYQAGDGKKAFFAVWRTKRAVYSVIANGTESRTVDRVVACLP